MRKKICSFISIAICLLIISLCIVFFNSYKIIIVKGNSMSPTLSSGNILLAKKDTSIVYYADIVIADVEFEKTERIIKRVVAMEGDKVSIIDGKLFINNLEMDKYHCHGENKEFIVEKNNIFVLGDNADDSTDSREFGTISLKDVIAVVDNK